MRTRKKGLPPVATTERWRESATVRVIPVLDLKAGVVVRGIAGRRSEYRPISSRLTPSVFPFTIAEAFRDHFGLTLLYVADLDAIAGQPPALYLYAELRRRGFQLWVDAGVRASTDAAPLAEAGIEGIVVGLETVRGLAELATLCRDFGPDRIVFSLDLKDGVPLGDRSRWNGQDAEAIGLQAAVLGVRRLIVLDLARVGMNDGTGTDDLCRRLAAYAELEIVAGGGVRGLNDLHRLRQRGVRAALVASALHDGRLTATDLRELNPPASAASPAPPA
jgi:phosphoribosylformimino-5-aminoimidazole carboxamide ribotide isomerase